MLKGDDYPAASKLQMIQAVRDNLGIFRQLYLDLVRDLVLEQLTRGKTNVYLLGALYKVGCSSDSTRDIFEIDLDKDV